MIFNHKIAVMQWLSLTNLELGVFLVDYEKATLTTYDNAVRSALLQRCSCLHLVSVIKI